ncbi:uncharacterized protein [Spinacia oleracea]|uniref:Uncharacterized protein isoform X1 n=2 Tax=Spinacia oleracea TaxID=3562 RepID=A0A9R0JEN1_SPIOL|nr:uncharacterized protein LOC110803833 isoform X1 [Spinacia oleracea]
MSDSKGKVPRERSPSRLKSEVGDKDGDKKHMHQLQDALALESLPASDSKQEVKGASSMLDSKNNGKGERTGHSNTTAVPRRSYHQHDDRRTAARDGSRSGRRSTSERGWWKDSRGEDRAAHRSAPSDPKVREGKSRAEDKRGWWIDSRGEDRASHRSGPSDPKVREGKSGAEGGDSQVWRHDTFIEAEGDAQPSKKRRPFREEKLPVKSEDVDNAVVPERSKVSHPTGGTARWEQKAHDRRPLERNEHDRAYLRERSFSNRGRVENTGFPSRDRFNGVSNNGKFIGRENFGGRKGYHSSGGRVEKWKHDLYDEANRSPTPKKEEDPVAKVEALLSL